MPTLTYHQVIEAGKPAMNHLANSATVRYDPNRRIMQISSYASLPGEWRGAAVWDGPVPQRGWRHPAGCTCPFCGTGARWHSAFAEVDRRS